MLQENSQSVYKHLVSLQNRKCHRTLRVMNKLASLHTMRKSVHISSALFVASSDSVKVVVHVQHPWVVGLMVLPLGISALY